jgi:elongator complex protein 2
MLERLKNAISRRTVTPVKRRERQVLAGAADGGGWVPHAAMGGHYGPVVDLAWGIDGRCLVSASEDQTARIWSAAVDGRWCELARPQVCAAASANPCFGSLHDGQHRHAGGA